MMLKKRERVFFPHPVTDRLKAVLPRITSPSGFTHFQWTEKAASGAVVFRFMCPENIKSWTFMFWVPDSMGPEGSIQVRLNDQHEFSLHVVPGLNSWDSKDTAPEFPFPIFKGDKIVVSALVPMEDVWAMLVVHGG